MDSNNLLNFKIPDLDFTNDIDYKSNIVLVESILVQK